MGWFGDLLARFHGDDGDDSPVVERPLNICLLYTSPSPRD